MRIFKKVSRIFALLICFCMISAILAPTADAVGQAEITLGTVVAQAGKSVRIPVSIQNNPGIAGLRLRISFNSDALDYISTGKGDVLSAGSLNAALKDNRITITWYDVQDALSDGELFTLEFQVAEGAQGELPLEISIQPEDVVNASWQQVDCGTVNGSIRIGGPSLSGRITSYGPDAPVTLTLLRNGSEVSTLTSTDGTYQFPSVESGDYEIIVSKAHHATASYSVFVETEDLTVNVKLNLLGDVNTDGKVNMKDWVRLYNHINEVETLRGYGLTCADVNGDGKTNMKDWIRLYNHISETDPMW